MTDELLTNDKNGGFGTRKASFPVATFGICVSLLILSIAAQPLHRNL